MAKTKRRGQKKAKVGKNVKKYVKRVLDNKIEDKHLFVTTTNDNILDVGNKYLMNGIRQGTGSGQRVGAKIRLKHFQCKYRLTLAGAAVSGCVVRVILFRDRQTNFATPSNTDIFQLSTAVLLPQQMFNTEFRQRFKVLYDKRHSIEMSGGSTNIPKQVNGSINKKLNFTTTYTTDTGTVTDINTNSLYMMVIGSEAANFPLILYNSLITYEDA